MEYTPIEVDIDLWFFAAAERLEEFSLVRDEILAEQRGKSHLYRRKPRGRAMSESGIKRSLQVFNAHPPLPACRDSPCVTSTGFERIIDMM